MIELSYNYSELLAKQIILISALFGGLSTTALISLVLSKRNDKLLKTLTVIMAIASFSLVIATFAMNNLLMISHPEYPLDLSKNQINQSRIIGSISFFIGILSFCGALSLSGWFKSKPIGITTTVLGIISYIVIFSLT